MQFDQAPFKHGVGSSKSITLLGGFDISETISLTFDNLFITSLRRPWNSNQHDYSDGRLRNSL